MNEEEKKKMEELEASKKESEEKIAQLEKDKEESEETYKKEIEEKNDVIKKKTDDLVGLRRQGQKLKELTDEEKTKMSQREIDLHDSQLKLTEDQDNFKKETAEHNKKETEGRRNEIFDKIAGEDKEYRDKLVSNFEELKGSDEAVTAEELNGFADKAANMIGTTRPNPINSAFNGAGDGDVAEVKEGDFADSEKGKGLAKTLGLTSVEEEKKED